MAWNTTCRTSAGRSCCRRVRRARSDWEQRDRRSLMWRDTDSFRLNVTRSILISSTWVKHEPTMVPSLWPVFGGSQKYFQWLVMVSSEVVVACPRFSVTDLCWTWLDVGCRNDQSVISVFQQKVTRSDWMQVRRREDGPIVEPWTMLAVIARGSNFWPACLVQWKRSRKMIQSNYILCRQEDRGMKTSWEQHCAAHCQKL